MHKHQWNTSRQESPFILMIPHASGRFYHSPLSVSFLTQTLALSANVLYGVPFYVPKPTTYVVMGIEVTTAGAGHARLGIYNDNNAAPGSLVADLGTVSVNPASVPSFQSLVISQVLQPGWYWLSLVSDVACTVRALTNAAGITNFPWLGFTSNTDITMHIGWSVAFTYAALPDPFTGGGALMTTFVPRLLLGPHYPYPMVGSTNTSTQVGSTSHTVNLPANIVAGDLLIVAFAYGGATANVSFPAGWTKFFGVDNTGSLTLAWRKADGTEGATITVSTTPTAAASAHNSYRIMYAKDPTVTAPAVSAGATGASGTADPDSLTPAGGLDQYLWLAFGASISGTNFTAVPVTFLTLLNAAAAAAIVVGSGQKQDDATVEDPGVFTGGGSNNWIGCTVAVYPNP